MTADYFFGYGSLVNRGTHGFAEAHPARLSGWRRAWRRTPYRQVSYLTVIEDDTATIDGLIARVPAPDWPALDLREKAYDRVPATARVEHATNPGEIVVYAIPDRDLHLPDADHPILLSYVDAVLQGYLREFGPAGLTHFVETTDGWDVTPIRNDRHAPVYPRAQVLDAHDRALVDDVLRQAGARIDAP